MDVVESWIVPCARDHSHAAPAVRAATDEGVIVVFVQVVGDEEEQAVGIRREDTDCDVEKVFKVQLGGKERVGGRASADADEFCGGTQGNEGAGGFTILG